MTLLREAKEDTVPTVAFADSFDGGDNMSTLSYYLASALEQVYAQPIGRLCFTGNMQVPCYAHSLLQSQQAAQCRVQAIKSP